MRGGEVGSPRSLVGRGARFMHEGCVACMAHEEGRVGGLVWCWRVWKRSPRRGARMRDVWVAGLML